MGYYTYFKLNLEPVDEGIISKLREVNEWAKYCLTDGGESAQNTKWYSHQNDLVEFSRKYPDTLFTLSGEGEEGGDLWKLYVKNGQAQRAEAVITYAACQL